jgi:diguanylate cyclase (GGDEF)-like protein/PAS domain S-box-containing protein
MIEQPGPGGQPRIAEDPCALLHDLVDHLDAMVAYWDADQRCRFANRAYEDWFGRGRTQLLGTSLKELLGPLYELNRPHIDAAYRGEKQVFERAIPRPGGQGVRHSLATYLPRIVDGQVQGMFVHVADVEPLKKLERALHAARDEAQRLATHDPLTGLSNRLALQGRMADMLHRAARTGERVFVMAIDLDCFKPVNDLHGHAAGDALLVEMAARIKSCVRDYDTVARLGGDEFLVLVSGMPAQEHIEAVAERLLHAARQPWRVGGVVLLPGLSIGIAEFPRHGRTEEALMLASDIALYAAKHAGRGGFSIAPDTPPAPAAAAA